ncbi:MULTISPECIES: hypothetical protein [unclassified Streptomyces]|nr:MULTISPECIES: hypothetical protein [unclassified Streptomyces]
MRFLSRRAPEPAPQPADSSQDEDWDGPDCRQIWEPGDFDTEQ